MSNIKRNDPCYCGSGKKYKKCCINGVSSFANDIVSKNIEELVENLAKSEDVTKVYSMLLEIIDKLDWEGSCHATSPVMYILFKELGLNAELCVGEVLCNDVAFDHSWVEIDGKVFDVAISKGLERQITAEPVVNGFNLVSKEECKWRYGGARRFGLDYDAMRLQQVPFDQYMSGLELEYFFSQSQIRSINNIYDSNEDGLWGFVSAIIKNIGLECDMEDIKERYKNTVRVSK